MMAEMIVLGLTLVLANVLTSIAMIYLSFKLMMNKNIMMKFVKKYMKMLEEITDELTEDLLKDEAE